MAGREHNKNTRGMTPFPDVLQWVMCYAGSGGLLRAHG